MEAKVVLLDKVHSDEDLSSVRALDVRNVDSRGFSEILARSRATDLRIYHLKIGSLDRIECLHSVTTLRLEWATKVTTLGPVYNMSGLSELQIVDFSRLAARGESLRVAVRTDSARLRRRRSLEYLGYSALRCSLHPDRIRLERLGPTFTTGC